MVAKSEAKNDGFQSPKSRGQVISLFVDGIDGPEIPQIFMFFFVLRAQKWEKINSFYKNLFLCFYPMCMSHFPIVNVSKYAFFAMIQLRISPYVFSFCFVFLSKRFSAVGP